MIYQREHDWGRCRCWRERAEGRDWCVWCRHRRRWKRGHSISCERGRSLCSGRSREDRTLWGLDNSLCPTILMSSPINTATLRTPSLHLRPYMFVCNFVLYTYFFGTNKETNNFSFRTASASACVKYTGGWSLRKEALCVLWRICPLVWKLNGRITLTSTLTCVSVCGWESDDDSVIQSITPCFRPRQWPMAHPLFTLLFSSPVSLFYFPLFIGFFFT